MGAKPYFFLFTLPSRLHKIHPLVLITIEAQSERYKEKSTKFRKNWDRQKERVAGRRVLPRDYRQRDLGKRTIKQVCSGYWV